MISNTDEPLAHCAEAYVYACDFYGCPAVAKCRPAKGYRHPTLDAKIREQRTSREARALVRCKRAGVPAPTVFAVDKANHTIVMQRLPGVTAKEAILSLQSEGDRGMPALRAVIDRLGQLVAMMHNADIIHGDLTTSNFIIDGQHVDSIHVIDLGLVKESANVEDKAVDLYVMERALSSTHPQLVEIGGGCVDVGGDGTYGSGAINWFLAGYIAKCLPEKGRTTLEKLSAVRARGRKRSMIG